MTPEEKAQKATEELREIIRDGHALLKDLRAAAKEARETFHDLTQEVMDECHKEGIAAIDKAFQSATAHGIEMIDVRFRRLQRVMTKNNRFPRDDKRLLQESEEDYGTFRAELKAAEDG